MTQDEIKEQLCSFIVSGMEKYGHSLRKAAKFANTNHVQIVAIKHRRFADSSLKRLAEIAAAYGAIGEVVIQYHLQGKTGEVTAEYTLELQHSAAINQPI